MPKWLPAAGVEGLVGSLCCTSYHQGIGEKVNEGLASSASSSCTPPFFPAGLPIADYTQNNRALDIGAVSKLKRVTEQCPLTCSSATGHSSVLPLVSLPSSIYSVSSQISIQHLVFKSCGAGISSLNDISKCLIPEFFKTSSTAILFLQFFHGRVLACVKWHPPTQYPGTAWVWDAPKHGPLCCKGIRL